MPEYPTLIEASPFVSLATVGPNGRAVLRFDGEARSRYPMRGNLPATVIEVTVESVYFQCARAVKRAQLWNPDVQISRDSLPAPGQIMTSITKGGFDGHAYDNELQERHATTLY